MFIPVHAINPDYCRFCSYISQYFTLEEGDLILTGTPAGVGPVHSGDVIEGEIPGLVKISFPVVQRK